MKCLQEVSTHWLWFFEICHIGNMENESYTIDQTVFIGFAPIQLVVGGIWFECQLIIISKISLITRYIAESENGFLMNKVWSIFRLARACLLVLVRERHYLCTDLWSSELVSSNAEQHFWSMNHDYFFIINNIVGHIVSLRYSKIIMT